MSWQKPNPGSTRAADDEGFLARWSRIKRTGDRDAPAVDAPSKGAGGEAEPAIDLAALPRIEDLTEASDFSAFLQKGVPEELRRLALRRAWALDPNIRDFIEVAENQYNWNDPNGVPGFGPLAPGTDIAALLAHAIGATPAPNVAADNADVPPGPDQAVLKREGHAAAPTDQSAQVGGPAIPDESPMLPDCSAASETPLRLPESASVPPKQHVAAAHKQIARRHGGALPAVTGQDIA